MTEEIFDEAFVEEVMDLSVPMDTAPILPPPPVIPGASSPIGSTVQLNLYAVFYFAQCLHSQIHNTFIQSRTVGLIIMPTSAAVGERQNNAAVCAEGGCARLEISHVSLLRGAATY